MSASTKQRNWALDCLRLVAVLLVVQRHQMGEPTGLFSPVWDALVRGGWVGVDIFFVLSGYLVGGLLFQEHQARGCLDWKRFLVRRGLKIYPAFYVWLAVAVAIAASRGHRPSQAQFFGELLFLQNYLGNLRHHTWSLAVEEHFYLGLTFLLASLARFARSAPFSKVPAIIAAVGIGCLVLRLATDQRGTALGSGKFSPDDLIGTASFATKILAPSDDLARFVRSKLRPETLAAMGPWRDGGIIGPSGQAPVLSDLNAIVMGPSIWAPGLFAGIPVRPEVRTAAERSLSGGERSRLNRRLLEDAFPRELSRKPDLRPFFWTHLRVDSLAFGVLLAYAGIFHGARLREWTRSMRWVLSAAGILCLAPAFMMDAEDSWWMRTFGFTINYLGAGALVLVCVGSGETRTAPSYVAPLAWLGSASYSIYLWHLDVIWQVFPRLHDVRGWSVEATALASLIASLAVGVLFGRAVEWPVLRWRDRIAPSRVSGKPLK